MEDSQPNQKHVMNYQQTIEAVEKGSIAQRRRIEQLKKDKLQLIEEIKAEYAKLDINKQESKEELNNKLQKLNAIIKDELLLYSKLGQGARNTYVSLVLKIKILGFFNYKSKKRLQENIEFINFVRIKFNLINTNLTVQEKLFANILEFNFKNFYDIYLQQNTIIDELTNTSISFERKKNKLKDELIAKVAKINVLYGDDIDTLKSNAEIQQLLPQIKKDFMVILSLSYTMLLFKEVESVNEYLGRIYNAAKPEVRALLDTNNKNSPLNVSL